MVSGLISSHRRLGMGFIDLDERFATEFGNRCGRRASPAAVGEVDRSTTRAK